MPFHGEVKQSAQKKIVFSRHAHVVCAPTQEYLMIITAYPPNPAEWDETFSKRKE